MLQVQVRGCRHEVGHKGGLFAVIGNRLAHRISAERFDCGPDFESFEPAGQLNPVVAEPQIPTRKAGGCGFEVGGAG